MRRAILLILICLLLGSCLISCGQTAKDTDTVTETESASATVEETEKPTESQTEKASETESASKEVSIVFMTDIHYCHINWYGMSPEDRMTKMVLDLNDYYDSNPFEAILFLGDYSLDFWETGIYGSWRHQGKSYTLLVEDNYLDYLPTPYFMIPGNHEQYGHELWEEITGFKRQFYVKIGGYLIFMLDNFAGELDPDEDIHGVYSPTDVAYVRSIMAENPDMPVLLAAHYFDLSKETEEFKELVKDDHVVALFCGHDHVTTVEKLSSAYNGKIIFHCGQYSYTNQNINANPWGWRTVHLSEDGIRVEYYAPESVMVSGTTKYEISAGVKMTTTVKNPLKES